MTAEIFNPNLKLIHSRRKNGVPDRNISKFSSKPCAGSVNFYRYFRESKNREICITIYAKQFITGFIYFASRNDALTQFVEIRL